MLNAEPTFVRSDRFEGLGAFSRRMVDIWWYAEGKHCQGLLEGGVGSWVR